jgi:hypothetical protein
MSDENEKKTIDEQARVHDRAVKYGQQLAAKLGEAVATAGKELTYKPADLAALGFEAGWLDARAQDAAAVHENEVVLRISACVREALAAAHEEYEAADYEGDAYDCIPAHLAECVAKYFPTAAEWPQAIAFELLFAFESETLHDGKWFLATDPSARITEAGRVATEAWKLWSKNTAERRAAGAN